MENWKMQGKPALMLIHMQNAIASEDGAFSFFGHAKAARLDGIIPRQQALLRAFRDKKLPIVFTRAGQERHQGSMHPVYGTFWTSLGRAVAARRPTPWDGEIFAGVAPQPGELLTGNWPTVEYPEVDKILKDNGVETLVLAGLATDIAVYIAAHLVGEKGYSVITPNDASTSGNRKPHEVIMSELLPQMGLVTSTEDVIKHL